MTAREQRDAHLLFLGFLAVSLPLISHLLQSLDLAWLYPAGVAAVAVFRYGRKTIALDTGDGPITYLTLLAAGAIAFLACRPFLTELPTDCPLALEIAFRVVAALLTVVVVEILVFLSFAWAVLRPKF